jgi:hypothetical protein
MVQDEEKNAKHHLQEFLKTGNGSGRRKKCKTPFAVIEYQNIKKTIEFDCHFEETISNYKSLTLTVSKGFWGYTVYTHKRINDK